MTLKRPCSGSSQDPEDKPTVYFTRFGGRYVELDCLSLQSSRRRGIRHCLRPLP